MTTNMLAQAQTYKVQLDSFLDRKFLDHACLLGLNSMVQSKFHAWIVEDFNSYYKSAESPVPQNQLQDFDTISLLEKLWSDFHYPIIKFFQQQHAFYYQQVHESFKESIKSPKKGAKTNAFKVKPVEMRKLNDSFTKLIKDMFQFYRNVLKHFATAYQNSLLPQSVLEHFRFTINLNAKPTTDSNVQANILYLIHKCLLAIGDVSRHRAFIEVSFVNPCVSHKEFFKQRSMTSKEKSIALKPHFEKSIQYYQFCILLLPALNEPYNHIGVIYNIIEDKFKAVLWLLRSQFTRIPDFQLGLSNLNRILSKSTFTNELLQIFNSDGTKQFKSDTNTADELNIMLICLVGYFYLPSTYKNGPNIVKKLTFSKIESTFFNKLSESFNDLYKMADDDLGNFFIKQLTVLMTVNKLIEDKPTTMSSAIRMSEPGSKLSSLIFRYIECVCKGLNGLDLSSSNLTNSLIIIRVILTWLSESNTILRALQSRRFTVEAILTLLNRYIDLAEDLESHDYMNMESFKSKSRPVRAYYFKEDVLFRDFSVIRFQFKDFDDNHLFSSINFNLLLGDYSSYIHKKIPSFLDNSVVMRLKQITSLQIEAFEVTKEIENYENFLRIAAVLVTSTSLFERNLDEKSIRFKNSEKSENQMSVEIIDSQNGINKKENKKIKEKKLRKDLQTPSSAKDLNAEGKAPVSSVEVENSVAESSEKNELDNEVKVLDSIEEIESSILSHTSQLHGKLKNGNDTLVESSSEVEVSQDGQGKNMKEMVDILVHDSSNSKSQSTNHSSSTWGTPNPNTTQFKIPAMQGGFPGLVPSQIPVQATQFATHSTVPPIHATQFVPFPPHGTPPPNIMDAGSTPYNAYYSQPVYNQNFNYPAPGFVQSSMPPNGYLQYPGVSPPFNPLNSDGQFEQYSQYRGI